MFCSFYTIVLDMNIAKQLKRVFGLLIISICFSNFSIYPLDNSISFKKLNHKCQKVPFEFSDNLISQIKFRLFYILIRVNKTDFFLNLNLLHHTSKFKHDWMIISETNLLSKIEQINIFQH